jgi:phage FluMu protein Com
MIRLQCPTCQAKLNAKAELSGQKRKCPKCGTLLEIPQSGPEEWVGDAPDEERIGLDEAIPGQSVHVADQPPLPVAQGPERLDHLNRYLICDRTKIFALWEDNGNGWMLKTNVGYVRANRNADLLPSQGNYTLVELIMESVDDQLRLAGIRSYALAERWALTEINLGDDRILKKVVGPGSLNREQKAAVRKFLGEHFMREVWGEAREVLDYLGNRDFHSQGVG